MKIALYTPYLDSLGGGEKYLLDIGLALHSLGYEVHLLTTNQTIKEKIVAKFGPQYAFIKLFPNWTASNFLTKLKLSRSFHAFFYQPDGSYFFSLAPKNFALLQVPTKALLPQSFSQKLKFSNWTPIFNSQFTKKFFVKLNAAFTNSKVLYPTVDQSFLSEKITNKEKIILNVGRFFNHLHAKKQEVLIAAFIEATKKNHEFANYQLVLCGSCQKEDQKYLDTLRALIKEQNNIRLFVNPDKQTLLSMYKKAVIYWHSAGYNENLSINPQNAEHFGISVLEAMSMGCIPIVHNSGGPTEIVQNTVSGFTYSTKEELINLTKKVINNKEQQQKLALAAQKQAQDRFGFEIFTEAVANLLK